MRSHYFHQQSLFKLQLNKKYYLELAALQFLNIKDKEGNSLTLYESDYLKFNAYLKEHQIDFKSLKAQDKLTHLENARVRVTKYFSSDNLKKYELDSEVSAKSAYSDIVSKDGNILLKTGEQNCVVLYENHVYIHPKIRCQLGSIDHEVIENNESKSSIKKGVIGVSHSSLCHGRQVAFAGSIVHDEKAGWIINTTSGHYITRVYQIKALLMALEKNEVDLSRFTLELWIPNNPHLIPPILSRSDYHIVSENAAEYLNRMQYSQMCSLKDVSS